MKYRGSTKNIYEKKNGLVFEFTDDYSIFDWGKMPDPIPNKGKYLAQMTTILFKELEAIGAKTHFIKKISSRKILVKKFKVIKIHKNGHGFDYSKFKNRPKNCTVPLECIFRFGVPAGSSLLKSNPDLKPNSMLPEIKIEFSTKLEPLDRKITDLEAKEMAGLSNSEFTQLQQDIEHCALYLQQRFKELGLTLWDGKFEFAFGEEIAPKQRELILIDSIGPDELRLSQEQYLLSKEYLRQVYAGSQWLTLWRAGKKSKVPKLKTLEKKTAQHIYKSLVLALEKGVFELKEKAKRELSQFNQHIIIFGQGGREHALAAKLAESTRVSQVTVIPGNPGMKHLKITCLDIPKDQYVDYCRDKTYAIIGPENLIAEGLSVELTIPCLAPSQRAGLLESSKAFAKELMQKYHIPTADFTIIKNKEELNPTIKNWKDEKLVVKKSGLAAGKGVVLCKSKSQALRVAEDFLDQEDAVVIEEWIEGPEVSLFVLCSENQYQILSTACDYKRLKEGHLGPNTGGMGCYSPAFWIMEEDLDEIEKTILRPTLKAMKKEKREFKGVLFIGLMKTRNGFKVLEYNTRFGDPETQTILPRITSDFNRLCYHFAIDSLDHPPELTLTKDSAVHVVKASEKYPFAQSSPQVIQNNWKNETNANLFFAGVSENESQLLATGGRVLGVTCQSRDLETARDFVYQKIHQIQFSGEQFRGDIGQ